MISSIFTSTSFIKNKVYNIFFEANTTQNNCIDCGNVILDKNNPHNWQKN